MSRDLAIALAVAVGIHIGSLLLFRFPELKVRQLSSVDASWVERVGPIDPAIAAQAAWTPRSQRPLLSAEELLPRSAAPYLPSWTPNAALAQSSFSPSTLVIPSFAQVEQRLLEQTRQPDAASSQRSRLSVSISGPLASYNYQVNTPAEKVSLPPCKLLYDVRVDPSSHAITWFTLVKSEPETLPQHIRLAEEVLQRLRFSCPTCGLIPGEVELHFKSQSEVPA